MKKYSAGDFKAMTNEERILLALTAIANELHDIYTALWSKEVEDKQKN